jgi:succinate dehydrogenase / fumarate reductase membrane anchor subunit
MIDKAAISDPTTHYGSPRQSTRHFMTQRLTAMLNVLFVLFFIWFVVRLAGADRAQMVETIRNPVVAIVLCLLVINVCIHMRIGMNEVIEDYLDDEKINHLAQTANLWFAILVAVVTVISVAKILFWG